MLSIERVTVRGPPAFFTTSGLLNQRPGDKSGSGLSGGSAWHLEYARDRGTDRLERESCRSTRIIVSHSRRGCQSGERQDSERSRLHFSESIYNFGCSFHLYLI